MHYNNTFDELIINAGLWGTPYFRLDVPYARVQLERFRVRDPNKRPTWQTTTLKQNYTNGLGSRALRNGGHGTEAALSLGWDVLDRRALSLLLYEAVSQLPRYSDNTTQHMSAWSDNVHFQQYVYTEINNLLLNKLCWDQGT